MGKLAAILIALLVLGTGGFTVWRVLAKREAARLTERAESALLRDTPGGYAEASIMLTRALKRHDTPERQAALAWAQALWALRGGPAELWMQADQRLDLLDRLESKPALAYAARGLIWLTRSQPGNAILEAGRGLMITPSSAELLWVRSRAERELEKPREALRTLEDAAAYKPDLSLIRFEQAHLLRALKKKKEAAQILAEVAQRSPGHRAAVLLGELASEDRVDRSAALSALRALLDLPEGEPAQEDVCQALRVAERLERGAGSALAARGCLSQP